MPDVQEVFRMATQKVRPDPGALDRQLKGQRTRATRRKVGAYVVVAALVGAALVLGIVSIPEGRKDPTGGPGQTEPPSPPGAAFTIDLATGATAPLPEAILQAADDVGGFAVSPVGGRIAFNGVADDRTTQVFVANLDGTGIRQLTRRPDGANNPTWSADGSMIAYTSPVDGGTQNVFVMDLATRRSTKLTLETRGFLGTYQLTPDGNSLLYTFDPEEGGGRLRIVPLDGGKGTIYYKPKEGDAGDGTLSPDGRYLSFGGDELIGGSANRWLADADGGHPRLLVEGNFPSATWSPDSTRLAYWSYPEHEVFVLDIESGESTKVAEGAWPIWLDDHTLIVEPDSGL